MKPTLTLAASQDDADRALRAAFALADAGENADADFTSAVMTTVRRDLAVRDALARAAGVALLTLLGFALWAFGPLAAEQTLSVLQGVSANGISAAMAAGSQAAPWDQLAGHATALTAGMAALLATIGTLAWVQRA